ncbi:MAG TPA: hypothetical protein VG818_01905 [Gemmatimonadaceae bacterium]|nr:hypothetical protein [Gemmatimonadaceae bacterium]
MTIGRFLRQTRSCACAVPVLLAACGGNSPTPADKNPNQVGASGGVVQTADQRVTLNVPAGAVSKDVVISVTPVSNPTNDEHVAANSVYQFGPEGTQFAQPVTLKLAYDSTALPAGTDPASLRISTFVNGAWQVVDNITVDSASHTVSGQIHHFSIYGVNADPCKPRSWDWNSHWTGHITANSCVFPVGPKRSDYFNVSANPGGQTSYYMYVQSPDYTGTFGIKDYDANDPSQGTVWAYSSFGTGLYVALLPGKYQLFVSSADTTKRGDYLAQTATVGGIGNPPCDPTFIGLMPGTYNEATLGNNSCDITLRYSDPAKYNGQHSKADYYLVKVLAGHSYTFTATIETANTNIALALYGDGGKFLDLDSGPATHNPKSIRFTPSSTMWVTVEVSASTISDTWNAPLGRYRIEVSK